ncbi:MAG: biopolymer transporter ExbD [Spirochaetaceae bacterium]|jgi:biopolymer transport protein ExbD|nr:biopolymer transporter ExbD [Spirochaetaceae bacterium]
MNIARRKRPGGGESAAFSDLAFLLIIYFIVIAGFNINKGFLLGLPAKDSSRLILKEELLRFSLDGEGRLFSGGLATDRGEAEKIIRTAVASYPNLALVLEVDPQAPWQNVVSFVELAQELAVETFSFTMLEASP